MKKVLLVSIDGMRPDGALSCGNDFVKYLMQNGTYTLDAKTVMPSITLPCHLSLFYSVSPDRHGTLNNIYVVPVRPVMGLFQSIERAGGRCAMFYGWDTMRTVCDFTSLMHSYYINAFADDNTDSLLTDEALKVMDKYRPDFVYLYLVETDDKGGHGVGWMSQPYLDCISNAFDCVKRIYEKYGDEYDILITADHGGHDRTHGTDRQEDMTIPMFFIGENFEKGKELHNVRILDLAPTITKIMGVQADREWEGKSLI